MNNECGHRHYLSVTGATYVCNNTRNHKGNHSEMAWNPWGYTARATWTNEGSISYSATIPYKAKEKKHKLELTLEDLKTIAYYLPEYSGEADDQDDITKAKIDKALKEAL